MDFSKVKCPNCGDCFFYEKFWGSVPHPEKEVRKCFCLCMNCESWFSFNVIEDQIVDGSYAIEEEEFMQDIEKEIINERMQR